MKLLCTLLLNQTINNNIQKSNTMKNLIKTLALFLCLAISSSAWATPKKKPLKNHSANDAINSYIESTTQGNTVGIENLFTDHFFQTISTPAKVETHKRQDLITYLKSQKGYIQNCQTNYSILEKNDNCAIAKITLQYKNFSKVEYVTICSVGETWKVSQVVTSYPKK